MATKAGMARIEDLVHGHKLYEVLGYRVDLNGYIDPDEIVELTVLSRPFTYRQLVRDADRMYGIPRSSFNFMDDSWWIKVVYTSFLGRFETDASLCDRGIMNPGKVPYNRNRWFVTRKAAERYQERLRLTYTRKPLYKATGLIVPNIYAG